VVFDLDFYGAHYNYYFVASGRVTLMIVLIAGLDDADRRLMKFNLWLKLELVKSKRIQLFLGLIFFFY